MPSLLESLGLRPDVALVAFLAIGACWLLYSYKFQSKSGMFISLSLATANQSVTPEPDVFKTPTPKPLPDFDLDSTKPQLYRPFRHGKNHITMGIRKLDWDSWIEMDSNFLWFHDTKVSELEKDLKAHVQYVDNAVTRDACFEVLEELASYLTARYPKIFQLKGGVLHNTLTGEMFNYPAGK
jgi:hypothetical protein